MIARLLSLFRRRPPTPPTPPPNVTCPICGKEWFTKTPNSTGLCSDECLIKDVLR